MTIDSSAQAASGQTADALFSNMIAPFSDALSSFVFYSFEVGGVTVSPIVLWLAIPMVILTVYFGFVNLRGFGAAVRVIRGDYRNDSAPGEVSQFQALSTALSGTVGIGNIAGVGVALGWGGPGATFWMILIGLFAMSVKFAECTLGVKYREVHANGTVSGGPMYYLRKGLANRGYVKLGILLSTAYAIFGMPTILNWATVNQMYQQVSSVLPMASGLGFGIVLSVLVGAVILGGIKSIGRVTSVLVPVMVIVYLFAASFVILSHITEIPAAFATIFHLAFEPTAVEGGVIGVILIGMRRAVYSTEAGLGTSSMVHSAAKTNEPVSEGLVGLLEPFIDTVVICTITALVIVLSGVWQDTSLVGVNLTSYAFETNISWFPYVLALAVFLFGFSTLISWAYYCEKIWSFVLGESERVIKAFRVFFILLLIPGALLTVDQVFDIIDSLFFLLAVPNIIGLYIMAPEIKADMKDYFRRLNAGEIKTNRQ